MAGVREGLGNLPVEARYLAEEAVYGSRDKAVESILHYALPPSRIEECDEGFVFCFYLHRAAQGPVLRWPTTDLHGMYRGGCGATYHVEDLRAATMMRPWVRDRLMTPRHLVVPGGRMTRPRRIAYMQETLINTGLSGAAMGVIMAHLPISSMAGAKRFTATYPYTLLLPITRARIALYALEEEPDRVEALDLIYVNIDAFCDKHAWLTWPRAFHIKDAWKPRIIHLWGKRYYGLDERLLRAELEGGD